MSIFQLDIQIKNVYYICLWFRYYFIHIYGGQDKALWEKDPGLKIFKGTVNFLLTCILQFFFFNYRVIVGLVTWWLMQTGASSGWMR